jgi:2-polyprenyl-3-methyl-5-hydroxy-6-metoxy-1,4-benzoquinol methylase
MPDGPKKHLSLDSKSDDWFYSHQFNLSIKDRDALKHDFDHSVQFYRTLLREYLPTNMESRILDLPCGKGRMVHALQSMGYRHVSGYDSDTIRLETGKKLGLPVYEGDVFEVLRGVKDNSIDCIFAMDFIEHLEKESVICFLDQTFHKIVPGGILVVRTPCADNPFGIHDIFNDFTHKWAATSGVLDQLLRNTGFSEVRIFGEEPRLGMRFGIIRMFLHKITAIAACLFLKALGHGHPRISTSSMWAVARKSDACDQMQLV